MQINPAPTGKCEGSPSGSAATSRPSAVTGLIFRVATVELWQACACLGRACGAPRNERSEFWGLADELDLYQDKHTPNNHVWFLLLRDWTYFA